MKRRWIPLVLLVAAGGAFALLSARAARSYLAPCPSVVDRPDPALPLQDVAFDTADGIRLSGWYLPAADTTTVVVLLHGHGGSRLSMLPRARFLHAAGYSCFLYDARAHGVSGGAMSTRGARETADLTAAVELLEARGATRVVGLGFSQGAATLLLAAPHLSQLRAAVVEASYTTLRAEIDHMFRRRTGLPGNLAGFLFATFLERQGGFSIANVRPIDGITGASCPVLVIGGALDPVAPPEDTRVLFAAASGPKQLWLLEGAGHEDYHQFDPARYQARILDFLARALAPPDLD